MKKEDMPMTEKEYSVIIASNLRRIAYEHGKTQSDISRDLNINKATISSWMNGTRIPRIKNVDLLCHYFNVKRTDIMEEYKGESERKALMEIRDKQEMELVLKFRLLNEDGEEALDDYLTMLLMKEKYTIGPKKKISG